MKKGFKILHTFFPLFLIIALLGGCGGNAGAETADTPLELAGAVTHSQPLPPLRVMTPADGQFAPWLRGWYGLAPEEVADGAVCYAGGVEATEIAVLRFKTEEAARAAKTTLETFLDSRAGDFTGYAPEQAAIAENGRIVIRGCFAALLICPDPDAAEAAFLARFGNVSAEPARTPEPAPSPAPEPTKEPPESAPPAEPSAEDGYDAAAVLAAWRGGDTSALSEKNRAVLDAARDVIASEIRDGMSEYGKELAIHDWMYAHAEYDPGELGSAYGFPDDLEPDPDNGNPYGFLLHGKGICLGYASTFQLFMDMLDIECITVPGFAHNGTEDHAWNMVRLDGDWYCVDVTWDDPISSGPVSKRSHHFYFNVTSGFLRQHDHQWDETGIPEADASTQK